MAITHPATRLLALDQVSITCVDGTPLLQQADWEVHLGQLSLILVDAPLLASELADCLHGLTPPQTGAVRFLEQDWQTLTPAIVTRQRRLIRRVFAGNGWLSNLTIEENILLSHDYDHDEPPAAVRRQAEQLAKRLGLGGLSTSRPQHGDRHELQLAQWLRALLRPGKLLLLESPLDGIQRHTLTRLKRELAQILTQGTAVVWIDSNIRSPELMELTPDRVYQLEHGHLAETAGVFARRGGTQPVPSFVG